MVWNKRFFKKNLPIFLFFQISLLFIKSKKSYYFLLSIDKSLFSANILLILWKLARSCVNIRN